MKLAFEYGQGLMEANLPDNTDVFIPGETVPDPPVLENIEEATRKSIQNPIGMPPIPELVKKGSKVVIASYHVPHVMHRDDFTPVNSHSLMRKKFDAIGQHMEKNGQKIFLLRRSTGYLSKTNSSI